MADASYDVVIIGSGAGGAACLWSLVQQNLKVLLLESGPAYDYRQDYRLDQPDWEIAQFPEKVPTRNRQSYAEMQLLEDRWRELRSWNRVRGPLHRQPRRQVYGYHHVVGLGGTTLHYTGEAHRLHPESMQMHSRFGVAADWPIDYAELEPYYVKAEQLLGVAGPQASGARWRSAPYPLPAHALGPASRRIEAGCRALGLTLQANSLAILSQPYDQRPGCNYCNNCNRGCPRADKGSVDVTFIRHARRQPGCEIITGAQVLRIEAGGKDRVSGVLYRDRQQRDVRIRARAVVVACGAIETPRLLLNSAGPQAEAGLANESGLVGHNLMETLSWSCSALHPEPLGSHRGLPSEAICWDHNAPDATPGQIGGCRFSSAVGEAGLVGPVNYARRIVGGWGLAHKQQLREVFGHALTVGAIGESLPNPGTFIDLADGDLDANHLPKARIHSQLNESELRRLEFMAKRCREILAASGATERVEEYGSYDYFSSTHVFGSACMGADPETSVVNAHGRSHRWKNLFIADASVFPSSGGGDAPSLTIQALAIRCGEHIAERVATGRL